MKLRSVIIITIIVVGSGWYVREHPDVSLRTRQYIEQSPITEKTQKTVSKIFSSKTIVEPKIQITSIEVSGVIEETNKQRVAQGLAPLAVNPFLMISAEYKVDDMITKQYFEHNSPTGEGVSDLGKRANYNYVIIGENLALGDFTDAKDLVDAWMNSPGHRANILSTKYQDIGVSIKHGRFEGKEVWFAVQHFGSSRGVCPVIDEELKTTIDILNSQLKDEEGDILALKNKLQSAGSDIQPWYQSDVATFNNMVDLYNKKLAESRKKIELYNAQVRAFNKCIAAFQ